MSQFKLLILASCIIGGVCTNAVAQPDIEQQEQSLDEAMLHSFQQAEIPLQESIQSDLEVEKRDSGLKRKNMQEIIEHKEKTEEALIIQEHMYLQKIKTLQYKQQHPYGAQNPSALKIKATSLSSPHTSELKPQNSATAQYRSGLPAAPKNVVHVYGAKPSTMLDSKEKKLRTAPDSIRKTTSHVTSRNINRHLTEKTHTS